MQAIEQQLFIREEQIIRPLVEVLDTVTPTPSPRAPQEPISPTIRQSLNEMFPEQQYDEKAIQKAKEILGETAKEFTQEQLQDAVTEIQYLCESWLDDFERQVFQGKTLNELLHEKGGL